MTETSADDLIGPLALQPELRWQDEAQRAGKWLGIPMAVALAAHLLLGTMALGGFDFLVHTLLGIAPQQARPKQFGDEKGKIDGVAAEVIDAAEFNKRYVSFQPGKAEADSEPEPASKASKAAEQKPAEKATKAEPVEAKPDEKPADGFEVSAPQPSKAKDEPKPKTPTKATAEAKPAITEAEIQELLAQTMEELQGSVVAVSAPGAARLGEASPFRRSVIRAMKQSMPRSRGIRGVVGVRFLVSPSGVVEAIRVLQSSGNATLDRVVVQAVMKTRVPQSGASVSERERMFDIAYEYR